MRAHDLSIAALLGETIYNFGELLQHPIMDSLAGTPHEWLKNLLFVFNEGNIGKFEGIMPVFPQEVRPICPQRRLPLSLPFNLAYSGGKPPVFTAKDLSHGTHRVCIQKDGDWLRGQDHVLPNYRRRDETTTR